MSQQQFYPQQPMQPQPPQPYAPQPQQQYAPVQPGYQQQMPPQAYAPQGYPQQAQQPPAVPLADGSLDAFYSQPSLGGGPGISWKGKPDGYTVQGVVPRDVTHADVSQEVGAPNTRDAGLPQFYRDGRPKFVLAIPLQVPASPEYPEGEARLYVRGQLRDELTRAMVEAGVPGAGTAEAQIKAGTVITVTLVQRKQGRGTIPQNIFHVTYTPAGGQPPAVQPAQQPVAQPQYAQQFAQAPVQQQYAPQVPQQQQYAPQPVAQAPAPQAVAQQPAPVQQAPVQQPVQQVAPVAQVPQQPVAQAAPAQGQPPMDPQQAALLAKLTGQQPQG